MDFYQVIERRRSIRGYQSKPVEDEKLNRILEAARQAPTAANRQPFRFYVIQDQEARSGLADAYSQPWFAEAPVIICACARPSEAWERTDGRNYATVDVTIAMDHLILAATAEGLGTCWIGAFKPDRLRAALNLPPDLEPIALTPLGYPDSEPGETSRKPLDDIVEHR